MDQFKDIVGTLFTLLWYNQKIAVYPMGFPLFNNDNLHTPANRDMPYDDVVVTTKDGLKLKCYLIRDKDTVDYRGTVLIFHGNATNYGGVIEEAKWLYDEGFCVFSLEYRGYSENPGRPSERGLKLDAQAAVDYILSDPILSKIPIVIYGRSLGGAVAIDVTSRNADKISALIIENTFTSIPDVVKSWPVLRYIRFLCTERWNSQKRMKEIPRTLPILMLSGREDEIIPPKLMDALWETANARGLSKKTPNDDEGESLDKFVRFAWGGHNTTIQQYGYEQVLFRFLDRHIPKQPQTTATSLGEGRMSH